MTTVSMFEAFLAAQQEMPGLQRTGINPHFKNRYVPLEELIEKIVPVLNKHGIVLTQLPTIHEGQPALTTKLIHTTGSIIETTMPLLCAKDDPQGQGSAITYARRYALLAMLGISADVDDDAERTRHNGQAPRPTVPTPEQADVRPPVCKTHGAMRFRKAGVSTTSGKPYTSFWACVERECKTSVNHADWLSQSQQMEAPSIVSQDELGDLPFED